jgi:hypothetical protein
MYFNLLPSFRHLSSAMGLTKEPYFGLTGGWLTFWLTVRLLHVHVLSQLRHADIRDISGSLCYRYDVIWI